MYLLLRLSKGCRTAIRRQTGVSETWWHVLRSYSIKPPVYRKSGNVLINALNYVKDVEEYQQEISENTSDRALASQLMDKISSQPELLLLLLRFHKELSKIGITATSTRDFTAAQVWKYRALYAIKLAKIHNVFWTQCQYLDISERDHKLGFLPNSIGILDPVNFETTVYEQLQLGVYKDIKFGDIETL
ncbi:hypothetical protein METSCH_B02180 [Metschnikowia aff. pulcherrima]|uniref:Uncharacterized protein n=1 Tax=Metschnikowia aff. pulcherrima TaxID=2163413 RepID=A0A4P6XN10_9ASCO|nr:hypothetical protein METSCH_B02180 [Metschnikowia aff. pulcherrima]